MTKLFTGYSNSAMAFDPPPPSDACSELTTDNGTQSSSSAGSENYQVPQPHSPRSPYPPLIAPPPSLQCLTPTDAISPIDIGEPMMPLSIDPPPTSSPRSARIIRVEMEPTVIHSPAPSSSRHPTITPQPEGQRARGVFRRLRAPLPNVSGLFRGGRSRVNGSERSEAQPRRGLSLGWTFRRQNRGSRDSKTLFKVSNLHLKVCCGGRAETEPYLGSDRFSGF